ncbi:MAG: M48 family metalloprotease [Pseudomonadota bacterium]
MNLRPHPLLLLLLTSAAWSDPYAKLPDMGEAIDREITTQEELVMGQGFYQALRQQAVLIENPLVNHYIQSLGQRLASASGWQAYPFHFSVIKDSEINAFAAPGGYISLFSGLIMRTENENELTGVMAHEMAHVTQRHIARMIVGRGSIDLTTLAAVAAAMIVGAASGSSDAGIAAAHIGMASAMQQQINFTREHEYEADRIGIQILADADFDPTGMVSFFEKLGRQEGDGFYTHNELLRTHPVTTNRIAEASNRADQLRPDKVINTADYAYAKATLAAELATQPLVSASALGKTESGKNANGSTVKPYYHALLLARAGQEKRAAEILGTLFAKNSDNLWIGVALADVQRQLKQDQSALQTLQKLQAYAPEHPVISLKLAQFWMNDDPERAYQFLRTSLRTHPHHTALLGALAEAAARANRPVEHHEALGMYFMAQQRLHEAHAEFETARALTFSQNPDQPASSSDLIARQRLDAQIKLVEAQQLAARERKKEQRH